MCGIVGYIGTEQAAPIILDGLSKLEYRGYDSAGMAIFDGEKINTKKAVGRLKVLENLTHGGESMKGTAGIGHTRWATHGAPSDINSHPHMNNAGTIAVVHNGIIENYIPLKKKMQDKGYQFISETDTEVLAHLLDYYYKGNPLEAITKVLHRVEGSYALGIMFADQPDKIFAARKDSPLIVGKSESGSFIASDVPAILKYTRTVYYVDNQEVVELKEDGLRFFSVDEEEITKTPVTIDWDANAAEKGGYEHFMLKEIYEQPKTINDTISPRIKDNDIVIEELNMSDEEIQEITKIHIVACGSAYHTGVTAKYVIEGLARIPVEVDVASEFRYRDPILQKGNMVIVISQSGETADTLATSYALATAIRKIGDYDIIIGGRQAIDGDTAQVGPQVAEKLGLTQVTYAEEILNVDKAAGKITVKRHIDGGVETVEGPLPIVITVNGSAAPCRPRNAKLVQKYKRALGAQEKAAIEKEGAELPYAALYEKYPYLNITEWSVADVNGDLAQCGLSGSPTKVKTIQNISFQAKESKTLTGSDRDVEDLIVELLANHTIG